MNNKLIVYGHHYCPDALRMEAYLNQNGIPYEWRDIADGNPGFQDQLRLLAKGYLSVPTIVFPDGKVLIEPNSREVGARWSHLATQDLT
jgi:mycoredoxin